MKNNSNTLSLSEYFYTIQGEGRYAGTPAIFFRFLYCNLQCSWCDTPYTWNKKQFDLGKELQEISIQEASLFVKEIASSSNVPPHIVFTGGEPLLEGHTPAQVGLVSLLQSQLSLDTFVEVETAGTKVPERELDTRVNHYNVSPKLSSSGNSREKRYDLFVLNWFALVRDRADFKFVITNSEDVLEVQRDFEKLPFLTPDRIFLMPEGTSAAKLAEKREWLFEVCKKYGYHYSDRLQVLAYGNRRGV